MHVLEYLADPKCEKKPEDALTSEYRLLCSGTLHRCLLGDWSKSEVARILVDDPLLLFVVSRPFDDYPLELALQLTVPEVNEKVESAHGTIGRTYHPDDEVVRDLAALLSLQCRRLITVVGKTNARYSDYNHVLFREQPFPLPFATSTHSVFWRPHPFTIITSLDRQEIRDYNPRPRSVDAKRLTEQLLGLSSVEHAESIVASCRLYALALELIHDRPDISYQLLISAVETIGNGVLKSFKPSDEVMVGHKKGVFELARKLDLSEEVAKKLAIEACRGEWWATKKFKKFLMDNVAQSIWTEQDELFHGIQFERMPKQEDFEKTLGKIYEARSKATHEGKPFPVTASYTGGPSMRNAVAESLFASDSPFPPIVWFERVVNSALCGYWERSIQGLPNL